MFTPSFITITGLDEFTDMERVSDLSQEFNVEWGVLFSRNKQGKDIRYPSFDVIEKFLKYNVGTFGLAAHLCGEYTQHIMEEIIMFSFEETNLLFEFDAWQINHTNPDIKVLNRLYNSFGATKSIIAQWRDETKFPLDWGNIFPLFDISGGKGISPELLPESGSDKLVGYAGGISPRNIRDFNARVNAYNYWLDMESGVRTDNKLDLDKVEEVLTAIYRN